jgi:xylan 1,4-beta-xylosidase
MKRTRLLSSLFLNGLTVIGSALMHDAALAADETFPVEIRVDAAESKGPLRPIWRFFGGDEPNYTYMKDGERLLTQLGELRPGEVYFRTHNLLTTGDGTPALKWGSTNAYTHDADGQPVYDWTVTDRIFDALLERGVKPYVQIGFMPEVLSIKPDPYQHEWRPGLPYDRIMTGWRHPPKDYDEWRELVYQWTKHCVEKYGADEVNRWYWETWNEANSLPNGYWGGTREEFFKLHDYAVDGVRKALPTARVGGPHSAGDGGEFTRAFLEHSLRGKNFATGERGTLLDFVAFHAKGAPTYVDGHVRMGIANQLATIDRGFGIVASFPELKETPIVIGESDPEGCAACQGPMFSYRNGTVYSSYTAASFARKHDLADKHGVRFDGAVTWAFEFEDQPYFAGFRQLASNGIPLAVLNVFRMFSQMGDERIGATSSAQRPLEEIMRDGVRGQADVGVLASRAGDKVAILVWHYHDDDVRGPDAEVTLTLAGMPAEWESATLRHYRVDEHHSNAYGAWRRMGSPMAPDERQYRELQAAAELALLDDAGSVEVHDGASQLVFKLPRQGVSLLLFAGPKQP